MANVLTPSLPTATPDLGQGPGLAQNHCRRRFFFSPTSFSSPFSHPSCKKPFPQCWLRQDSEWMNQKGMRRKREGKRILWLTIKEREGGHPLEWKPSVLLNWKRENKNNKQKTSRTRQTPETFQLLLVRLLFWTALDSCQLAGVIFFPSPCLNFLY